ncbi:MAG TPA: hypothetical protein VOA87_21760 [Thermoanaerobaculia bacterium]|nr:hypothetical protein [Thermoanaerobaculia bacterium]
MRRNAVVLVSLLSIAVLPVLSLLVGACAAFRYQHAGARPFAAAAAANPVAPEPEAPPAADDFKALGADGQLARSRSEVAETKRTLAQQGKYRCCVKPACNECLLKRGECHCRDVVAKQGPCCGECTEAWIEGRGAVEGVTALELLRRKEKMLTEGDSGQPHLHER